MRTTDHTDGSATLAIDGRRIAANIAKPPELLRKYKLPRPHERPGPE